MGRAPAGRVRRRARPRAPTSRPRDPGAPPRPDLPLPSYAHPGDAGADLLTTVDVTPGAGGAGAGADRGRDRAARRLRRARAPALRPGRQARPVDRERPGHHRRRLPRRDQGDADQPRPREPIELRRGDRIAQLVVQRFEQARSSRSTASPTQTGRRRLRFYRGFGQSDRQPPSLEGERVKFRRKSASPRGPATDGVERRAPRTPGSPRAAGPVRRRRTWPPTTAEGIDLGSLLVTPAGPRAAPPGRRGDPVGAVAACWPAPDGALELRAFAAPRDGDLWTEVRREIAAELAQRGGTATEHDGPFGTELVCQLPCSPRRQHGTQPSRIIGVDGPRWMLRGTLLGQPGRRARRRGRRGRTRSARSSSAGRRRDGARRRRCRSPCPSSARRTTARG